jgi:Zn-finger nucleic acid-binding protein
MSVVTCPGCSAEMERIQEPDITTDSCASCGGLFFDHGELNAVATAVAGDIELCSVDLKNHEDRHPTRFCPKCREQEMRKVNLLEFSDVILDFCPTCSGFFLDRNELGVVNAYLAQLSDTQGDEEFRGKLGGRLVRIDRLSGVAVSGISGLRVTNTLHIRIIVYLRTPLDLGLRLTPERWTAKLAKAMRVYQGEDVQTGFAAFDDRFLVTCEQPKKLQTILQSENLREALKDLASDPLPVISRNGKLEVLDTALIYTEGPYSGTPQTNIPDAARPLALRMVRVADMLEQQAA